MTASHVRVPCARAQEDWTKDENIMRVVNPRHYLKLDMGGFRICRINWVSTLAASALLWSMVGWCIDKENSSLEALLNGQAWVTQNFTWLYIGTQDVWTVFLIYLVFSKVRSVVVRARARSGGVRE